MRSRTAFVSLAVVALALAGCGKTNTAATVPATTSSLRPGVAPVRSATYSVSLAGVTGGAPNGSGIATINIEASTDELCWQFSQLKNVTAPTVARIFQKVPGGTGSGGYQLGAVYNSSGCVHEPSVNLGVIEDRPSKFYVSIHDAQFPGGAVRGPLTLGGR